MARKAIKSIPLQGDDGRTPEVDPPRPSELVDSAADGESASGASPGARSRLRKGKGQWIPLPLAPRPGNAVSQESPRTHEHRAEEQQETRFAEPLSKTQHFRNLDRVVHDFVASLDHGALGGTDSGTGSDNAERFLQLLQSSPSTKSQVLGPAVLLGSTPPICLQSLFGFLGSMHKTGILRVQSEGAMFMVSIVNGDIVHGVSYPRPESELLGNILVARGAIDSVRIDRFFRTYGTSASKIGEALNRQALVSTSKLKEALEQQMQQLFDRLLSTRSSEWCFHEGEATLAYIDMRMNVIGVLLESARKQDEGTVT